MALLAIAIGIGATTAVFTPSIVFFSALFPIRMRAAWYRWECWRRSTPTSSMFAVEYFDLRDPGPFEALTSFQAGTIDCDLSENNPLRMQCLRVEAGFLKTLGVRLAAGREFSREEDAPNGPGWRSSLIPYGNRASRATLMSWDEPFRLTGSQQPSLAYCRQISKRPRWCGPMCFFPSP